jgi:hypothetical protein
MRTSLDIPDPVYREIKLRAESERRSIREFILEGVAMRLGSRDAAAQSIKVPLNYSTRKGKLVIANKQLSGLD